MWAITAFPARSRSTKKEAIVTSRSIKGNNEKNVLKANAPAHCAPSIRENFLRLRQSIAQTRRVSWTSLFGLLKDTMGRGRIVLAPIIELCLGDGSFMLVLLQPAAVWLWMVLHKRAR